ncbi:fibrinogen-like protein A [Mytilus edulis]|uniref:fibrinogen-like protein A n=1 Tax=Mytilus edulis TaxID=6550 RepID=UPI0039F036C3
MKIYVFLLCTSSFATNVIWCDTEAKMKILGSLTATGTMKNFAKDTIKTVKLATEIKNMLNGMCVNSKDQNSYKKIGEKVQNISIDMEVIKEKLDGIQNIVSNIKCIQPQPKECYDISNKAVGLQTIYPDGKTKLSVQCEVGGWTVIQKRYDGSVEFHRNWKDYENGFGNKHGEFWLGNKNIAQLTSEGNHELRIDVEDWNGKKHYAVYKKFSIGDASTKYRLSISIYSGNAGDGMSYFNGMKFSTYDQDNDRVSRLNCADDSSLKGGWWYNNCWRSTDAMLNGHYTGKNSLYQGIRYRSLGQHTQKKSTMKIRKVQ